MSKLIGNELPEMLYRRLAGVELSAWSNKAILVSTVDSHGFPHPAILSYCEVVARDARTLRLATYKDSSTTSNMRRNGKVTFIMIDERMAYYIKGNARELAREMNCSPYNSKLECRVEQVLADEANEEFEPGVYITSGVTYQRPYNELQTRELLKELLA